MAVTPYGGHEVKNYTLALKKEIERRASIENFLRTSSENPKVITDRPGWLTYRASMDVIDLSGEMTTDALRMLNDNGALDQSLFQKYARREDPTHVCFWNAEGAYSKIIPCDHQLEVQGAYACAINWNAVP